jgi:hypothetical protein
VGQQAAEAVGGVGLSGFWWARGTASTNFWQKRGISFAAFLLNANDGEGLRHLAWLGSTFKSEADDRLCHGSNFYLGSERPHRPLPFATRSQSGP